MTDENELEGQSRRTFLKTTGAVGVAATTGVAAFGGNAAAQRDVRISDITAVDVGGGLIDVDVTVVGNNIQIVEDVIVTVQNVEVAVLKNVTLTGDQDVIDIDSIDVSALNANAVVVQLLSSSGDVLARGGTNIQRR